MIQIFTSIILMTIMNSLIIFDFDKNSDISNWKIIDDVVMGGRSSGSFNLSPEGHGIFTGSVSLDNYGGFSSVRYQFEKIKIKGYSKIVIRLKGDGKRYQVRIKNKATDYFSYIAYINTSKEWQMAEILLNDMYPSFRGRRLDEPNFSHDFIEETGFMIANNKAENFQLLIDKIEIK